jgi:hypothetical protein
VLAERPFEGCVEKNSSGDNTLTTHRINSEFKFLSINTKTHSNFFNVFDMNDEPTDQRPAKRRRLSHHPESPASQSPTLYKGSYKWDMHDAIGKGHLPSPKLPSSSQSHMNAPLDGVTSLGESNNRAINGLDEEFVDTSDNEERLLLYDMDEYEEEMESLRPASFDNQGHLESSSPIENRPESPPATYHDSDGNESFPDVGVV